MLLTVMSLPQKVALTLMFNKSLVSNFFDCYTVDTEHYVVILMHSTYFIINLSMSPILHIR